MNNVPVIILGGHYAALDIARRLGRKDKSKGKDKSIDIYVHDAAPDAIALSSRYVRPLAVGQNNKALLEAIRHLAKTAKSKPVLFITSDAGLEFTAAHFKTLTLYTEFSYQDTALITALLDKNQSAELFSKHKISTPKTEFINDKNFKHNKNSEHTLSAPLVLKPLQQTDWTLSKEAMSATNKHKALRIENTDDAAPMIGRLLSFGPIIAQEYIPGSDGDLYYFVGYRDSGSRMLCAFTGRKMKTVQDGMGSETILRSIRDEEIEALGRQVFEKLNIRGIAGIDIKRHAVTGKLYVIEVNYRFGLSDGFISTAGINLPELYYKDALGFEIMPAEPYCTGLHWIWLEKELDRARISPAKLFKSLGFIITQALCGRLSINEWSIRDPAPLFKVFMNRIRRRAKKASSLPQGRRSHVRQS